MHAQGPAKTFGAIFDTHFKPCATGWCQLKDVADCLVEEAPCVFRLLCLESWSERPNHTKLALAVQDWTGVGVNKGSVTLPGGIQARGVIRGYAARTRRIGEEEVNDFVNMLHRELPLAVHFFAEKKVSANLRETWQSQLAMAGQAAHGCCVNFMKPGVRDAMYAASAQVGVVAPQSLDMGEWTEPSVGVCTRSHRRSLQ